MKRAEHFQFRISSEGYRWKFQDDCCRRIRKPSKIKPSKIKIWKIKIWIIKRSCQAGGDQGSHRCAFVSGVLFAQVIQ